MSRRSRLAWLPIVALALAACSDGGPAAPADGFDLSGEGPLSAVMPDLAAELGTAGTAQYVPTLGRIFSRAARVVRDKHGAEAADRLVGQARTLRAALVAAREAKDEPAIREALRKLERFEAGVGFRVFGPAVARHVHGDAAAKLDVLSKRLREAEAAGQDVSRYVAGAQQVARNLAAARDAAGKDQPVLALIHAAHGLDLVIRLDAAF